MGSNNVEVYSQLPDHFLWQVAKIDSLLTITMREVTLSLQFCSGGSQGRAMKALSASTSSTWCERCIDLKLSHSPFSMPIFFLSVFYLILPNCWARVLSHRLYGIDYYYGRWEKKVWNWTMEDKYSINKYLFGYLPKFIWNWITVL